MSRAVTFEGDFRSSEGENDGGFPPQEPSQSGGEEEYVPWQDRDLSPEEQAFFDQMVEEEMAKLESEFQTQLATGPMPVSAPHAPAPSTILEPPSHYVHLKMDAPTMGPRKARFLNKQQQVQQEKFENAPVTIIGTSQPPRPRPQVTAPLFPEGSMLAGIGKGQTDAHQKREKQMEFARRVAEDERARQLAAAEALEQERLRTLSAKENRPSARRFVKKEVGGVGGYGGVDQEEEEAVVYTSRTDQIGIVGAADPRATKKAQQEEYAQQLREQQVLRQQQQGQMQHGQHNVNQYAQRDSAWIDRGGASTSSVFGTDAQQQLPRKTGTSTSHASLTESSSGLVIGGDPEAEKEKKRVAQRQYARALEEQRNEQQQQQRQQKGQAPSSSSSSTSSSFEQHKQQQYEQQQQQQPQYSAAEQARIDYVTKRLQQQQYQQDLARDSASQEISSSRVPLYTSQTSHSDLLAGGGGGGVATQGSMLSSIGAHELSAKEKKREQQREYYQQLAEQGQGANNSSNSSNNNGERRSLTEKYRNMIHSKASSTPPLGVGQASSSTYVLGTAPGMGVGPGVQGRQGAEELAREEYMRKKAMQVEYARQMEEDKRQAPIASPRTSLLSNKASRHAAQYDEESDYGNQYYSNSPSAFLAKGLSSMGQNTAMTLKREQQREYVRDLEQDRHAVPIASPREPLRRFEPAPPIPTGLLVGGQKVSTTARAKLHEAQKQEYLRDLENDRYVEPIPSSRIPLRGPPNPEPGYSGFQIGPTTAMKTDREREKRLEYQEAMRRDAYAEPIADTRRPSPRRREEEDHYATGLRLTALENQVRTAEEHAVRRKAQERYKEELEASRDALPVQESRVPMLQIKQEQQYGQQPIGYTGNRGASFGGGVSSFSIGGDVPSHNFQQQQQQQHIKINRQGSQDDYRSVFK